MKKLKYIITLFVLTLVFTSCKNEKTLQEYIVESHDKPEFINFDVPTSFIQLKNEMVSNEIKEAVKSIRKINVIALQIKENNKLKYEAEKAELKKILKSDNYKDLMSMKYNGINVKLYYTGETNEIDEIIAFGYGDKFGVGVARLLGDEMNPALIMEMMQHVKMDPSGLNLGQFGAIFSGK